MQAAIHMQAQMQMEAIEEPLEDTDKKEEAGGAAEQKKAAEQEAAEQEAAKQSRLKERWLAQQRATGMHGSDQAEAKQRRLQQLWQEQQRIREQGGRYIFGCSTSVAIDRVRASW